MKLSGRRESNNVEDRRGGSVKAGGIGLGAVILGIIAYATTGDLGTAISTVVSNSQTTTETTGEYQGTALEDSLERFSRQILASTEDVWKEEFSKLGKTYQPPTLVFYKGTTQTACGTGSATSGPFYCSGDEKIYLDLDFLATMKQSLGASGDFTNAYVIAHEVAHHVQNQLGYLGAAHKRMNAARSESEANKMSVRIELQADYLAGVWGNKENAKHFSLEVGDMEEALDAAKKIGDDYLQRQAGYNQVQSDAFTHGTSAQRTRWLKKGLQSGNIAGGDTYSIDYNSL
ncbi:MAG: neutral zinc metallopeptidase [Paludibacteraceae bacterium]|nr:neutral zinc metallopeptidase [Paludibacteraceae bacterium]